jgi:hypothetical protein
MPPEGGTLREGDLDGPSRAGSGSTQRNWRNRISFGNDPKASGPSKPIRFILVNPYRNSF